MDASPAVVEGFRLMTGGTLLAAASRWVRATGPARARRLAPPGRRRRSSWACTSAAASTTPARTTARASACSTTSRSRSRVLKREKAIGRAAIVDCDVHHGNGTAFIFAGDRWVFTFSMHQEHNYPVVQAEQHARHPPARLRGRRAVPAPAGGRAARASSPRARTSSSTWPGPTRSRATSWEGLSLTKEGLRRRDRLVFTAARELDMPVVVTLAGGYARRGRRHRGDPRGDGRRSDQDVRDR